VSSGSEAIARYFVAQGARVTVTDPREPADLEPYFGRLRGLPIELCVGGWDEEAFGRAARIVLAPHVSRDVAPLALARARAVPVSGESAFALTQMKGVVVAVAGGAGRSATATLLHGMLRGAGRRSFHGGGLASPLIDLALSDERTDVVVAELSCAELGEMTGPAPALAVFPRLDGCEELLASCDPHSVVVLNLDDPLCAQILAQPSEVEILLGCPTVVQ
jgi:UDP-N-acetylmuramoylalanine-D-glutamate ligase